MITEYQIANFKAFGSPQTLPIRPITLIFGPNSSGKSSIFQSLLMLKQTIEQADNPETTLLFKGDLVDLGSFRELINHHDFRKRFSCKITLPRPNVLHNLLDMPVVLSEELRKEYTLFEKIIALFNSIGINMNFSYDKNTTDTVVSEFSIFLGEEIEPLIIYKPYDNVYFSKIISPQKNIKLKNKLQKSYLYTNIINYFHRYFEAKKNIIEYIIHFLDKKKNMASQKFDDYNNKLFISDEIGKQIEDYLKGIDYSHTSICQFRELLSEYDHKLLFKKRKHSISYGMIELLIEFQAVPQEKQENFISKLTDIDFPLKDFLIMFQSMAQEERQRFVEELIDEIRPDSLTLKNYLPHELNSLAMREIISEYSGYDSDDAGNISLLALAIPTFIENFLDNLLYLGPQRENPERYYSFSGNLTRYVGKSGKFVADLLITDKELQGRVNKWFNCLDLGYELKISSLADSDTEIHDLFALRLCDKNGVHVGLTDVGFGVSQVLPVIVQSVVSRGKTILIEQPEYHLHPRLQAELGDMFIESALGDQKNTFLIETHSEHLILRIMRRMRETYEGRLPEGMPLLRPQDVSVVYVEKDGDQSIIREMPLNERGELVKAWPGGFFEEGFREVMA